MQPQIEVSGCKRALCTPFLQPCRHHHKALFSPDGPDTQTKAHRLVICLMAIEQIFR